MIRIVTAAVCSVLLSLTTADAAGTYFCRNLNSGADLETPPIDVNVVSCPAPTGIRSRVDFANAITDGLTRNSVSTICVEPLPRLGTGDKEVTLPPLRTRSQWAEAPACKRALTIIECDQVECGLFNFYCVQIECMNSPATPFVVEKIKR